MNFDHILFNNARFTNKETGKINSVLNKYSHDVQSRNLSYRNSIRRENSKVGDALCKNIVRYMDDPSTCDDEYLDVCNSAMLELTNALSKDNVDIKTISDISKSTKKENGDLLINGSITVEVKFSKSNGTHYNTSTDYFKKLGAISYSEYLLDEGYFSKLDKLLSYKLPGKYVVSYHNNSPLKERDARDIITNHKYLYSDEIVPLEKKYRRDYSELIYDYIKARGYEKKFLEDMVTKQESNKSLPDYYLFVDKEDLNNIRVLDKSGIGGFMISTSKMTLARNTSTFRFEHAHITIGWQNGTGLNNPTLRVFLDD